MGIFVSHILYGTKHSYIIVTAATLTLYTEKSNFWHGTFETTTSSIPISELVDVGFINPTLLKRGYIYFRTIDSPLYKMGVKMRNRHRVESLYINLRRRINFT